MKNLALIITLLLPFLSYTQYPINEEFDSFGGTGEWTVDNGGGVQNYGGAENYGTFNIGTTPYLNNTTHTIQSPIYDFTDCGSDITISFPMIGLVEDGADIMNFEYFNGGTWVTDESVTGFVNGTYTNTGIPNTSTRFRFQLITDGPNLVYFKSNYSSYSTTLGGQFTVPVDLSTQYIGGAPKTVQTYYYDITRFTINCVSALPIELIDFYVVNEKGLNHLSWVTVSELNNEYFIIENSVDGYEWNDIGRIDGAGNSNTGIIYDFYHEDYKNSLNYYRLSQVDFDGVNETFNIIVIDNKVEEKYIIHEYDYMGQPIKPGYNGLIIRKYSDGSTEKIIR